jgi:N-acetylglucosaminyldiphosphoundecaprenol N-acetyl-beta-D-mannosaminyltransferase
VSRLMFGSLPIDAVTREQALDVVEELVGRGEGGAVFTPNVDHVVLASGDARMRAAYARVSLSLVDGMPLLWASRLMREPLPEKISGSDLVFPLLARAAERGWRVYFLGGGPGVGARARDRLHERLPRLEVVGLDASHIDVDDPPEHREAVLAPIRAARPDLVLVALGAPKQEIWIDQARDSLRPCLLFGMGASLDFVAETVPRAPGWMSGAGLEWLYRLWREPRRLWRRYLVRDPKFLLILARTLASRTHSA